MNRIIGTENRLTAVGRLACWVKKVKGLRKKNPIDTDNSKVITEGKGVGKQKRITRDEQ